MRFILILAGLMILAAALDSPRAEDVPAAPTSCARAKTTADLMVCVKKNHDRVQTALESLYKQSVDPLSPEEQEKINTTQKYWIVYRNDQCAYEAAQAENESMKRIRELSCLTRLTQDRVQALKLLAVQERVEEGTDDLVAFPRWLNVLADENPDVFWQYAQRLSADLDCDGAAEEIVTGLVVKSDQGKTDIKPVVSIADNPVTGKPKAHLFVFDVSAEKSLVSVCDPLIAVNITNEDTSEEEEDGCRAALKITHGSCAPIVIYAAGDKFDRGYEVPWAAARNQ